VVVGTGVDPVTSRFSVVPMRDAPYFLVPHKPQNRRSEALCGRCRHSPARTVRGILAGFSRDALPAPRPAGGVVGDDRLGAVLTSGPVGGERAASGTPASVVWGIAFHASLPRGVG
jgi:hypothetical protein